VAVSASSGGGNSPGSDPPTYNDITVSSGTGSNNQTLTNAVSTVLQGVANGVTRNTSSITVNPSLLYEFTMSGYPTSTTAGSVFSSGVLITAYDEYTNQKIDYTGNVTWTSSDPHPATLPVDDGSGWTDGQKSFSGSSFILFTSSSQTITVQHGAVNKTSDPITVSSSTVVSFNLNCSTTQTAGSPFILSVASAQDLYGNSWNGTVTVSVPTGENNSPNGQSPTINNISVISGTGQAYQIFVNAETGVTLRGSVAAVTDEVTGITVGPNVLSLLTIRDAAGGAGTAVGEETLNVGESLNLYSAGYDAYGNFRGDENTNWSSQGLTPPVTDSNINTVVFIPTATGTGTITSTDPATTISDQTGTITVNPGAVVRFEIAVINTQVVGQPFPITVTAYDVNDNVATGFNGTVAISDLTATINPILSGTFVDGEWTGGVTIFQDYTNNTITVKQTGAPAPEPEGTSNPFDVTVSPGMRIAGFEPVQGDTVTLIETITTNQDEDWFLKMRVENMGSSSVQLDSSKFEFIVDGFIRTDYTVDIPNIFWSSGTAILAGGGTDSILIKVDVTGENAGPATVQGFLYLSNTTTGGVLSDHALTTLTVQTPAQLIITDVIPSQDEATVAQTEDWTVKVVIRNVGGSAVMIDSAAVDATLSYSQGTGWQVIRPESLIGGGWVLEGGERDTLLFTIDQTGTGASGACIINASIYGVEINTGDAVQDDTQDAGSCEVIIEEPASLQVIQVENLALNSPYVNKGQSFNIRVSAVNSGGDGVHDLRINLVSDGVSSFPAITNLTTLAGDETTSVVISGTAAYTINPLEIITVDLEAYADNNIDHLISQGSTDDTTRVVIQDEADLIVERVVTSRSQVLGGQADPWTVKIAVHNQGQAVIILDTLEAGDISFRVSGIYQSDYLVIPPVSLKGGGLYLETGEIDTLIYTVTSTGRLGGSVEVRANINGRDKNDNNIVSGTNSTTIIVQSETNFRIIATHIQTLNKTDAGNGYVNTDQIFNVIVVVENGLGETVNNVQIGLQTFGASIIQDGLLQIDRLTPTRWDSVEFVVNAAALENLSGEKFTATINQATLENSGLPAPVGSALDSTAVVFIQEPAHLSLSLELSNTDGIFSTGQNFILQVSLLNSGTGAVDSSGRVHITLPPNYTLVSPGEIAVITTDTPVQWNITAPSEAQSTRSAYVILDPLPKQKNTGTNAEIYTQTVSIDITTILSQLAATLSISSPEGAADGVVSSGQSFELRAIIQWVNVKDITAEISLPSNYKVPPSEVVKSVISPEIYWQIEAPGVATGLDFIRVSTYGMDARQEGVEVEGEPVTFYVTTVSRADLSLDLSITSPEDATDGAVSLGQEFVVSALVENRGDADTAGVTRVSLNTLPDGYTTFDPMNKDLENSMASWTIKAPLQPRGEAVNIEAAVTIVPQDVNTNEPAFVSRGNDAVPVTTEGTWLAVSINPLSSITGTSVVTGQSWVKLMILKMDNRGVQGANSIAVTGLRFRVEDLYGDEIQPNTALSTIFAVNQEDTTEVYGTSALISEVNPVYIPFSQDLVVPVEVDYQVAIYGNVAQETDILFFQLNVVNSSYVDAKDVDSGVGVPVNDETGNELNSLQSNPRRIFYPAKEKILQNFPNPFGGPGNEETTFIYYLEDDTDIDFWIYTLTGKLVWSKSYLASDPQGRAGLHSTGSSSVRWDGRNDKGFKVLNGVYILIIRTADGKIEKTKVAVVK
jgi:hypothetical protein